MIRALSLATVLATACALPARAEDAKSKIEPGTGPTSTITDQVPKMKADAGATKEATPQPLPSSKAVSEAVPAMKPGDAATGASTAATSAQPATGLVLSEESGRTWINKPVYSSDGKMLGEVVAFQRDAANKVIGMHADIGGFLGLGQTRVNLTSPQFKLQGDRVVLDLTAAQAKDLPKVEKI